MKKDRKTLKDRFHQFLEKAAKENQSTFDGKPSCCSGKQNKR